LFQEMMGGDGPRATPAWFDGRVYALGAHGELQCLEDDTGRVIWRRNILEDNGVSNLQWGMAAAPLIVDDAVVVLPGGSDGRSIVAYDRRSGNRLWSAENDPSAYSSPMLATLADTRQIVVLTATRLIGLTPGKGEVLWQYPWVTHMGINASQPLIVSDSRVFVSSSYGVGAALLEITRDKGAFSVREVWRNNRMKNRFTSSVLHEGHIYGLDESILTCLDAKTGEVKWKGGRRSGARPRDAGQARRDRAVWRPRGQDLEPPRARGGVSARQEPAADGGVRLEGAARRAVGLSRHSTEHVQWNGEVSRRYRASQTLQSDP
jgi:outer membrane protein assembly factor BamB